MSTKNEFKEYFSKEIDGLRSELGIDKIKINSNQFEKYNNKIDKIENKYDLWANNFFSKKYEKEIKYRINEAKNIEQLIELNNLYRNYYLYFFSILKEYIISYNKKSTNKIIYNIPEIPKNIFFDSRYCYFSKITFKNNITWLIRFDIRNPSSSFDGLYPIIITVYNSRDTSYPKQGDMGIFIRPKESEIGIYNSIRYFDTLKLNDHYSLKDYKKSFNEIIKDLLEYQIIKSSQFQ